MAHFRALVHRLHSIHRAHLDNDCLLYGQDDDGDEEDLCYRSTFDIQKELVTIPTEMDLLTKLHKLHLSTTTHIMLRRHI